MPGCRQGQWLRVLLGVGLAWSVEGVVAEEQRARTRGLIAFQCGVVETTPQDAAARATLAQHIAQGGHTRLVVQFAQPLTPAERRSFAATGLRLLASLGDNAFFAGVRAARGAAVLRDSDAVRWVAPIDPRWKLHPDLLRGDVPDVVTFDLEKRTTSDPPSATPSRLLAAYVLFHRDASLEREGVPAVWRHGGHVRSRLRSINAAVVELPLDAVQALAAEDVVQWIEPALPPFGPANNDNRLRTEADIVQAAPYNLDGSGIGVMIYDMGYGNSQHPDFGGRHHTRDTSGEADHSTHVAGTVGGNGALSNGLYRGMAPAVTLESYGFEQPGGIHQGFLYTDPGDLERDYDDAIHVQGVDLANNSLSTNVAGNEFPCHWEGDYGVTSALIDTIVRGDPDNPLFATPFRVIWANGNERQSFRCMGVEGFPAPYHSTPPPACAKNLIAVGAINSNDDSITTFTSFGPADDGRLRPDIVAPGCQTTDDLGVTSCIKTNAYRAVCGTSFATPTVTGLCALILQDFRQQYPELPDPRNSSLKALLAHTARDIEEPGPDYQSGYGSVRVQAAIDVLRAAPPLEAELDQDEVYAAVVVVAPDDPELKVTLAWDDFPGTPNANPVLVNDLDLRVYDESRRQYYPWTLDPADPPAYATQTRPDRVNNIEQVYIAVPKPGPYRVEVHGYQVPAGPQSFSLVATPKLARCTSAGTLALDRAAYRCQAQATLRVVDCDLNTDDQVIESVDVEIASTSEPAGESVRLTETGPASAVFVGSVALDELNAVGVLRVAPGDTVTATYVDADNGQGGTNVPVVAGATVDCAPPVIANVQVAEVNPRDARITLDTDEPALVTLHYGLDCNALVHSAATVEFDVAHEVSLSSLVEGTDYFCAVAARDAAGNTVLDDNGGSCYSFATPVIPKYFTEAFEGDFDLAGYAVRFTPDSSSDFYAGCIYPITALPTDPTGATEMALPDDGYVAVTLAGGAEVSLFDQKYSKVFVGSNGYLTFGTGDTSFTPTLAQHFALPRVAAVFADLNPPVGGKIKRQQLEDRLVITFEQVVAVGGTGNGVTFQVEMFFDGRIHVSYLTVDMPNWIAGLSAGNGLPGDFYESDLSAQPACGAYPPIARDVSAETLHNEPVLVELDAEDDGLPDPPALLTFIIETLPSHGTLRDPGAAVITADELPYTLVSAGRDVWYTPNNYYGGPDEFTFKANDGGEPPEGGDSNVATAALVVGQAELIHSFTLDEDPGWTTTGLWAFGVPTGGGSHNLDPTSGHTGANAFGYNLAGDYENNLPARYLTTTPIDCSDVTFAELRFYRWLGIESASFDQAAVHVSSDGRTWQKIWEHKGGASLESAWTQQRYEIAEHADEQPTVYIRWQMGPTDKSNTYPGWNVDDVEIWGVRPAFLTGDVNCDFVIGFGDINPFILALSSPGTYEERYPDCPLRNRDLNEDGRFDFDDINPFIRLLTIPPAERRRG